jgi:hypothetical protein
MLGDVSGRYFRDIAVRFFAMVSLVGQLRILIPLGREDALATEFIERDTDAPDACEEVDEGEARGSSI